MPKLDDEEMLAEFVLHLAARRVHAESLKKQGVTALRIELDEDGHSQLVAVVHDKGIKIPAYVEIGSNGRLHLIKVHTRLTTPISQEQPQRKKLKI